MRNSRRSRLIFGCMRRLAGRRRRRRMPLRPRVKQDKRQRSRRRPPVAPRRASSTRSAEPHFAGQSVREGHERLAGTPIRDEVPLAALVNVADSHESFHQISYRGGVSSLPPGDAPVEKNRARDRRGHPGCLPGVRDWAHCPRMGRAQEPRSRTKPGRAFRRPSHHHAHRPRCRLLPAPPGADRIRQDLDRARVLHLRRR